MKKIVVFGGRGFVGSNFIKEALKRNVEVISVSRSLPSTKEAIDKVTYAQADALNPEAVDKIFQDYTDVTGVFVSIGSPPLPFVDKNYQIKMNGDTCVNIIDAADKVNVPRCVLINAAMPSWAPNGYRFGKELASKRAQKYNENGSGALIIRTPAVSGIRWASGIPIPLNIFLWPLRFLFGNFQSIFGRLEAWIPGLFWNVLQPPATTDEIARFSMDFMESEMRDRRYVVADPSHLYKYTS